jgi:hypothetical protein
MEFYTQSHFRQQTFSWIGFCRECFFLVQDLVLMIKILMLMNINLIKSCKIIVSTLSQLLEIQKLKKLK